jgi:hypothetical protein
MDNPDIGNKIDGVNGVFSLVNYPLPTGGVQLVVEDGTITTAFVVNEATGQITMTTPPVATLYATYYYYLMGDDAWDEFVLNGMEILNRSTGDPTIDVPMLEEGLIPALKSFAVSRFCMRVATQTGLWYNQRLQERVEDRDSVSKKFLALGAEWLKQGSSLRDGFYLGSGTEIRPAFTIVEHIARQYTPNR